MFRQGWPCFPEEILLQRCQFIRIYIIILNESYSVSNLFLASRKYSLLPFQIELNMIAVTIFLTILNKMKFHLVQNQKENCHPDHISLNLKAKTCSCLREWRLLASYDPFESLIKPLGPSHHYRIDWFKGCP